MHHHTLVRVTPECFRSFLRKPLSQATHCAQQCFPLAYLAFSPSGRHARAADAQNGRSCLCKLLGYPATTQAQVNFRGHIIAWVERKETDRAAICAMPVRSKSILAQKLGGRNEEGGCRNKVQAQSGAGRYLPTNPLPPKITTCPIKHVSVRIYVTHARFQACKSRRQAWTRRSSTLKQ